MRKRHVSNKKKYKIDMREIELWTPYPSKVLKMKSPSRSVGIRAGRPSPKKGVFWVWGGFPAQILETLLIRLVVILFVFI